MALRAIAASPGFAGKFFVVCAIGLTGTGWYLHETSRPASDDALSEVANDAPASATVAASGPAASATMAQAPAAPVAPTAPAYRVESAVVEHSFSEAAQRLGLDASTTARLTRAFAGRLDFRRDLQRGSEVSFVFRNQANVASAANARTDATNSANANVTVSAKSSDTSQPFDTPVAVRISTGKDSHDLFLYRNLAGKAFYYSADGHSATPSFLRYPVKFTRVSSHFAMRRLDPVTHRVQPHEGVDLAAPIGTPVHATARGTVAYVGWKTGYGKVVMLDNFGPYSTTFAHLSRFAKHLKAGDAVRQGEVIGYVGKTGWATGPHLHYEVHVDEVAQDPLTVDLPHRDPLRGADKQRFAQQVERLDALL